MSGTLVHSCLAKIEWLNGLILHIRNGLKLASVCMASEEHLQGVVKVFIKIYFGWNVVYLVLSYLNPI
jgi:hypothetical protein